MSTSDQFEMEYRLLGKTGLKVSVFGFGCMTCDTVPNTKALLSTARKYGINFFDHAEVYGNPAGNCEAIFGQALKELQSQDPILWRRSDLIITTKLFYGPNRGDIGIGMKERQKIGKNEIGLSKKRLSEGIDGSLKRLCLDYVDIVLAHRCDPLMSMKEIVESFTDMIRNGKALYWGTSNWKPIDIINAYWTAQTNPGLIAPILAQEQYNMFNRILIESEFKPLFDTPYNYGCSTWGALDSGILTGKYINKRQPPKHGRLSGSNPLGSFKGHLDYVTDIKLKKVEKLSKIAKELDVSLVNLALGWLIKNDNVSTCLLGATRPSQIDSAITKTIIAANRITPTYVEQIENILDNKPPKSPLDRQWRTTKKLVSRL
eukprot:277389_1